jgi:esterase/lipase superfamily enzyme
MEFLRFGHSGTPVVIFPTPQGNHTEFAAHGMLETVGWKIDQGLIQVYCVDTNNWDGWYNPATPPRRRMELSAAYEEYFLREFLPHLQHEAGLDYLILAGMSFGAYYAVNFGLKHPELVHRVLSFGGSFTIAGLLDGYYDDLCYFNDPAAFVPNLTDPWFLEMYNTHTEFTFVTSDHDLCLGRNVEMSNHLSAKGIRHHLIVWEGGYTHDWPAWKAMFPHYI